MNIIILFCITPIVYIFIKMRINKKNVLKFKQCIWYTRRIPLSHKHNPILYTKCITQYRTDL